MLIYKGILIEIQWLDHQKIYHWKAYQGNKKIHDSLKQCGFSKEKEAMEHAKQEIDFLEDTEE